MTVISPGQDFETLRVLLVSWGIREITLAALGTFVGAFAAFKLQAKLEFQKLVLQESSAINSAFSLVFSYINTAENFKKQLLMAKKQELSSLSDTIAKSNAQAIQNVSNAPVGFNIRHLMRNLVPVSFHRGEVASAVGRLRYVAGRPQIFAHELEKCGAELGQQISMHNEVIEAIKLMKDDRSKLFSIVGLSESGQGVTDERYRNTLEQMSDRVDDIVFFGSDILFELMKYHKYWKSFDDSRNLKSMDLAKEWHDKTIELRKSPDYNSWEQIISIYSKPV